MLLGALGACGGGDPSAVDAGGPDALVPDAELEPDAGPTACLEFDAPSTIFELPASLDGDLSGGGADIAAPANCDVVDAPFGIVSAGADRVYALAGLTVGTEYVVRLRSNDEDLAFYVVSGCGGAAGPTSSQCLLFEDGTTAGHEVGTFVADDDNAYVVVDYYDAGEPATGEFTLDVYEYGCQTSGSCGGTTPVCQDFRCSGCASDYDCDDPAMPLCDEPSYTCVSGYNACTGDDPSESGDDGPAGAVTLGAGASVGGAICNSPGPERDFFRFHVDTGGEHWTIELGWSAAVDLDLEIHDEDGNLMGLSYWEQPERIALTYLPPGDYYADIDYYASSTTNVSVPYTISATRVTGDTCASATDCGADARNQIYRGDCVGGACQPIEGDGALPAGSACDSLSDCDDGSRCYSWFFVDDPDTNMVCGSLCGNDGDCAALGSEFVCANWVLPKYCVVGCSSDLDCPLTDVLDDPTTPPWQHLSCNVATGQCG